MSEDRGGYRGGRMPERDEQGRFMTDDDRRGVRYEDRGYRSRGRDDDDRDMRGRGRGGWFADPEGHSEASRRGWERGDHGPSGWFGDPEGHAEASRRGWEQGHNGRGR
jgi:hypothetical protein